METRPFGQTGERFPILSLGCQRIVDAHQCSEEQAVAILNAALDRGVRYFDTAWVYSDGQSEKRVGLVAKRRRAEMWIATKTVSRTRDGALKQLEQSLARLRTDHVDEWRLHNIWDFQELEKCFAPGGAMEAMVQAKAQGLVRHISISGHTNPMVQLEALRRFPFDSVLMAASVLDHFIFSFAEEFLPTANNKGVATIAMKVLGFGALADLYEKALRYAMSLPVSTVIVGCASMDELTKDLAVADGFVPLSARERLDLFRQVLPVVQPRNLPWKANDWDNPTDWRKEQSPT
jgi:aryl-alcohol dehydrogenase-like predicted oxidoreductase